MVLETAVNGNARAVVTLNQRDFEAAHRYAQFAFLYGFSSRVRASKHLSTARIGEEPRRNANYAYLRATRSLG